MKLNYASYTLYYNEDGDEENNENWKKIPMQIPIDCFMDVSPVSNQTVSRFFVQASFKKFYLNMLDGTYLNGSKIEDEMVSQMREIYKIP